VKSGQGVLDEIQISSVSIDGVEEKLGFYNNWNGKIINFNYILMEE
jgi:hypothetical protein